MVKFRFGNKNGAAQLAQKALEMDSETSLYTGNDGDGRMRVFSNLRWKSKFIRWAKPLFAVAHTFDKACFFLATPTPNRAMQSLCM